MGASPPDQAAGTAARTGVAAGDDAQPGLRKSTIGGKLSADKLEKLLNDEAADGWQLGAITSTEVEGRVGPGGVDGLPVMLERPAQ